LEFAFFLQKSAITCCWGSHILTSSHPHILRSSHPHQIEENSIFCKNGQSPVCWVVTSSRCRGDLVIWRLRIFRPLKVCIVTGCWHISDPLGTVFNRRIAQSRRNQLSRHGADHHEPPVLKTFFETDGATWVRAISFFRPGVCVICPVIMGSPDHRRHNF